MRHHLMLAPMLLSVVFTMSAVAQQGPRYTYTTIDVPGALHTWRYGINNLGQMVGVFVNAQPDYSGGPPHGFLTDGAHFTTIDIAGPLATEVRRINDAGQIVGTFWDAATEGHDQHAFVGGGTIIDPPDSEYPKGLWYPGALGINNAGHVVGDFLEGGFLDPWYHYHGFLYGGGFTTIDFPYPGVSHSTIPTDINDHGQIVGTILVQAGEQAVLGAFLKDGESFVLIAAATANGVNNAGHIVGEGHGGEEGWYGQGAYLMQGMSFTQILVPGAGYDAHPWEINDHGQIVGYFGDLESGYHGFLASPVLMVALEPSPRSALVGQPITLTLTVTNTTGEPLTAVTPSALTVLDLRQGQLIEAIAGGLRPWGFTLDAVGNAHVTGREGLLLPDPGAEGLGGTLGSPCGAPEILGGLPHTHRTGCLRGFTS